MAGMAVAGVRSCLPTEASLPSAIPDAGRGKRRRRSAPLHLSALHEDPWWAEEHAGPTMALLRGRSHQQPPLSATNCSAVHGGSFSGTGERPHRRCIRPMA